MNIQAHNCKLIRSLSGMSQDDFANHIGLKTLTYWRVERGIRELNVSEFVKTQKLLYKSTHFLINAQEFFTTKLEDIEQLEPYVAGELDELE